jgi:3-methyladenine DNA glycosylase AlkD
VAAEIRSVLKADGCPRHAHGVQWFFKEEIQSQGWRTADLRRLSRQYSRALAEEHGLDFVVGVADLLFTGHALEEKVCAVLLLENLTARFDDTHFVLFESWLDRISTWADHDGLVHYLIAPMIRAEPARARKVFAGAKSPDRWHRRAAAVALIQGTRRKMFFLRVVAFPTCSSRTRMTWCAKGWGGCCAKPRKPTPDEPCLIS